MSDYDAWRKAKDERDQQLRDQMPAEQLTRVIIEEENDPLADSEEAKLFTILVRLSAEYVRRTRPSQDRTGTLVSIDCFVDAMTDNLHGYFGV